MKTGTKFRATIFTWSDAMSSANRRSGARRRTTGTCTANWMKLPTTDPHASSTARRGSDEAAPNATSVAIIAAFHITGAV